jgi:hypothetical protein
MESRFPGKKAGLVNVADFAGVDQLDGLPEAAPPASLCSAGCNSLVLAGRLDELSAFPYVVRDGLFNVSVFAGLHGPNGGQSVPVIGGGYGDRVDILVLEDATHIGFELGAFAGPLKDGRGGGFGAAAVDVDNCSDFDVGDRENFADMRGSPRADTYDGEVNAIIRAGPGLRSGGRGRDKKVTAVHIFDKAALPVYFTAYNSAQRPSDAQAAIIHGSGPTDSKRVYTSLHAFGHFCLLWRSIRLERCSGR